MARSTIADLAREHAPGSRNPINAEPYLETASDARREDALRLKRIDRSLDFARQSLTMINHALVDRLKLALQSDPERFSLASAQQMRGWRLAAVENVWRLAEETGPERCFTWTAIPGAWILTVDEFEEKRAVQFTERFRSLLNRSGAGQADGWLLAKIDIEFDLLNNLYRVHLGGIASGGMVDVLDRLRGSSVLKPQHTPAIEGRRIARPLQIDRRPLTNLPMPLSYVLKSHFTARWLGIGSDGQVKRGNHPCRIPEPYGTQSLLWLDRQRISDMFVMYNLAIRDRKIVVRK